MTKNRSKFMIVDGNAILHRAWHALPPMIIKDGTVVHAAYGFITTLFKAIKEFKPDYVAVTFDRKEKTFRHEESKDYKATRVKQPDELYAQIPIVKEILSALNIQVYEKAGFEADDVIGTLARLSQKNAKPDLPTQALRQAGAKPREILNVIVTGDMDTLQLVDDNTEVYTLRKGMSDTVIYNEQTVKERYDGLVPSQLIDYKGLRGDPSDNISGVPGIGEKTAIGLLKEFGSIDELYKNVQIKEYKNIKVTERVYNLLMDNKDKALQSKKLAEIIRNVDIDFNLNDCELKAYDKTKAFEVFQRLEFKSLLNRLPEFGEGGKSEMGGKSEKGEKSFNQESGLLRDNKNAEFVKNGIAINTENKHTKHNYQHISEEKDFETFFKELKKQKEFCFDTETSGLNVFTEKLLGISFCWEKGRAFFVDAKKGWLERLKPVFADEKVKKIGHNMKFDAKILKVNGVETNNFYFDTMIASYLLNPGTRAHNLDDLVFRELGYQMTKLAEVSEKTGQKTIAFHDEKVLADYSCEDADYTWRLVEKLKTELENNEMRPLFETIEMPLIEVLIEMEMNGVKIDTDHLKQLSKSVNAKINSLTKKIHKMAGEKFNISSPLQLKKILFEKLNLSKEGLGKTKTGISTAAGELEKLHDLHPIIELIEEYRELTKLESTYIDALPKLICKNTGRLHTDFNQSVTATGRLSSSNPNLQNIPIRNALGKEMRKAFIAEKGNVLISADYSQIELRIIACLSGDKNMIKIFEQGLDIHRATAAKIFNIPLEKVDDDMRSAAKEVNFGVLYGMGAWGLASRKKISRADAKEFIDKYFETFSDVKNYLEKMKDSAREKGYAETMFGRRRYLPEINSGVQQIRAAAERMAINMPIQGTAADLIKIAMIEIYKEIKQQNNKTAEQQKNPIKMLLQVHDELVFEAPADLAADTAKLIDEKMEKIHKFCVPIKVNVEEGKNWQEMTEI